MASENTSSQARGSEKAATDGFKRSRIQGRRRAQNTPKKEGGVNAANNAKRKVVAQYALAQNARAQTQQQQAQVQRQQRNTPISASAPKKKMTGPFFYLMLVFALLKDISDALFGITLILSILSFITGLIAFMVLGAYYFFNGVTPTARKIAAWATAIIMEFIPLLSIVPFATAQLVVTRWLEHKELAEKVEKLERGIRKLNA